MDDCVFCNIVNKQVPAKVFYEDPDIFVIQDILPKAPVHMLVIPKRHLPSLNEAVDADAELLGRMLLASRRVAGEQGVAKSGYRLRINVGKEGGQIVPHFHIHILGGKQLED